MSGMGVLRIGHLGYQGGAWKAGVRVREKSVIDKINHESI
jgi:hypothetical protein